MLFSQYTKAPLIVVISAENLCWAKWFPRVK